ncbi:ubiquitinyl hydrolase 1 [Exophiala xenobiotica]|nr:ubiquitinyl hydrolase 1 [Exophiala xenobiotica]
MAQKTYIPLENNPEVMTKLAHELGLSTSLAFQDAYSLTEPDLVAILPRPANALLFIYPCTEHSEAYYARMNEAEPDYQGSGPNEPVMFYHQTIHHACGLIGLLHCITNGTAADLIQRDSGLDKFTGDTTAPPLGEDPGHAFIAFVKGKDGHLWELEGRRKGPVDLGRLEEDEDVLSEKALNMGPLPFMKREEAAGSGVVRFSCTVLGPSVDA